MKYGSVSSLGSRTVVPSEWVPMLARVRDFAQPAQIAFLRVVSAFSHSAAQHCADMLGLATPLVPTGSNEQRYAMVVRWLDSPQLSAEGKVGAAAGRMAIDGPRWGKHGGR